MNMRSTATLFLTFSVQGYLFSDNQIYYILEYFSIFCRIYASFDFQLKKKKNYETLKKRLKEKFGIKFFLDVLWNANKTMHPSNGFHWSKSARKPVSTIIARYFLSRKIDTHSLQLERIQFEVSGREKRSIRILCLPRRSLVFSDTIFKWKFPLLLGEIFSTKCMKNAFNWCTSVWNRCKIVYLTCVRKLVRGVVFSGNKRSTALQHRTNHSSLNTHFETSVQIINNQCTCAADNLLRASRREVTPSFSHSA